MHKNVDHEFTAIFLADLGEKVERPHLLLADCSPDGDFQRRLQIFDIDFDLKAIVSVDDSILEVRVAASDDDEFVHTNETVALLTKVRVVHERFFLILP